MDAQLRTLVLQKRCGVLEALRRLAGASTYTELADKLGISRQVLYEATRPYRARSYGHILRSIEAQMGFTQYLLDDLVHHLTQSGD